MKRLDLTGQIDALYRRVSVLHDHIDVVAREKDLDAVVAKALDRHDAVALLAMVQPIAEQAALLRDQLLKHNQDIEQGR